MARTAKQVAAQKKAAKASAAKRSKAAAGNKATKTTVLGPQNAGVREDRRGGPAAAKGRPKGTFPQAKKAAPKKAASKRNNPLAQVMAHREMKFIPALNGHVQSGKASQMWQKPGYSVNSVVGKARTRRIKRK